MDYSFCSLGSLETRDRILDDIDGLFQIAKEKNLIPNFLTVGPLFIDITSIQSLIFELLIDDLNEELIKNYSIISNLIQTKRELIYKQCDSSGGLFEFDEVRNINVIFDPDEVYMSLLCSENKKTINQSSSTKSEEKNEYIILKYKPEEILPEIKEIYDNQ